MYVQVVTYGLAGIDEGEYLDVANSVAARFAGMPGLLAKLWLGNTDEGRYGAVYLWEDREAMERFLHSDLFEAFNPEFEDVAVEDFDVLENLTSATQPVLEVLEPKRRPPPRTPRPAPARKAVSGARKVPVTSKAATTATKKTAKKAAKKATTKAVPRAKKAAPAAKGATKKAATTATKKAPRKAR